MKVLVGMPNVTSTNLWHRVDGALVRTAARRASNVRDAIRVSVNLDEVIEQFLNDFHEGTSVTSNFIRTWARSHIRVNNEPLNKVLATLYAEGYVLGQDAGLAAIGLKRIRKDATEDAINRALSIDWSTWKPGNAAASALANPKAGLKRLLDKRVSALRGLGDTTVDRIGTVLSNSLAAGLSSTALAEQIKAAAEDVLMSSSRALTIANTEMNNAMSVASMDVYSENDVQQVEWIGLEACDICDENIDASPIPLGEEFPSGDTEPAAHGNCRCSIAPVVDFGSEGSPFGEGVYDEIQQEYFDEIMSDKSIRPELKLEPTIGVPGPVEIERALSRLAILPNPADADIEAPEKYVESPWQVVEVPTIDPNVWDKAVKVLVPLNDLFGTDPFLKRKRVAKHIEAMGQALTEFRSYPLVVVKDGSMIIIDGHHRLMSIWLLGQEDATVWKVEI